MDKICRPGPDVALMVNWDQSNKVYFTLYSTCVAFLLWKIITQENTRKAKLVLILKPQMTIS